ncbi:MAG: hypothetical protein HY308_08730 [Gammaproteobacteria bacterium]|nr:hypothetical protein [Gammaproteobacteria bacterium]
MQNTVRRGYLAALCMAALMSGGSAYAATAAGPGSAHMSGVMHDMLAQIARLPGVHHAEVNYVAGKRTRLEGR